MKKFPKIFAVAMLAAILASTIPLSVSFKDSIFKTKVATAVVPVADAPHTGVSIEQWVLDTLLRTTLEVLKRRLLDHIVDQIIVWIQGGGTPRFVTDWEGFLENAGNEAVGDFAQELGLGFLCQPFNLQIRISLLPVPRFGTRAACTLDQIVANIDNFYADFRNGGWIAYDASWAPQNNIFGLLQITGPEILDRIELAQGTAFQEALAGDGFLSQKSCEEETGPWPPGQEPRDIDQDGTPGDISETCTIVTPGKTVGDLASKSVGIDLDYILAATELEAYVSAIANALINRLIVDGVGLLNVSGTPPPSTAQDFCVGLTGQDLIACQNYIAAHNTSFTAVRQEIIIKIDAAIPIREEGQTFITNSITRVQNYLANLNNLLAPCQNRTQEVSAEIAWAQTTLTNLQNESNANFAGIQGLKTIRNDIRKLGNNKWSELSALQAEIQEFLDPSFSNDKRQENQEIISRVNTNLQNFRNNCTPGPVPALVP